MAAATTTTNLADVPMPALAIQVDAWHDTDTPEPGRYFTPGSKLGESNATTTPGCPRPLSAAHQLGREMHGCYTFIAVGRTHVYPPSPPSLESTLRG